MDVTILRNVIIPFGWEMSFFFGAMMADDAFLLWHDKRRRSNTKDPMGLETTATSEGSMKYYTNDATIYIENSTTTLCSFIVWGKLWFCLWIYTFFRSYYLLADRLMCSEHNKFLVLLNNGHENKVSHIPLKPQRFASFWCQKPLNDESSWQKKFPIERSTKTK